MDKEKVIISEITDEIEIRTVQLPLMALRGITVFPEMIINFDVERKLSLAALNNSLDRDRLIFMTAQRDIFTELPEEKDLYRIGTVCKLRQFIKNQNGGMRVMVEGKYRAEMITMRTEEGGQFVEVRKLPVQKNLKITPKTDALIRQVLHLYEKYLGFLGGASSEVLIGLTLQNNVGYIADYIIQNMTLKHDKKQKVLEEMDPIRRLRAVSKILGHEIEVLSIEQGINEKLKEQLQKIQKDNILREQMRAIRSELGEGDDLSDTEVYREKILALKLDKKIEEKLLKENDRLSKQSFGSAEASVLRSYLDICLELPWHKMSKDRLDIGTVRKILDADHFGLEKVKERIIEHLAVKQLKPDENGTILCLVGPPGVGKTSIAYSIARSMNRKLARMSLGGIHDEAEIRGHRKTYVGSMPGRIINAISQAETMNPLLLLDEIDKLGSDYKGDPSSALLEVLDPEQNKTFRDNFLEVPFDLSHVFFVVTANTTETIPRPLLDRMEVIELSSYTDEEKLQIAKRHLVSKQRKKHGLNGNQLKVSDEAIREIITSYTKESGVRQLERQIAALCRKTAKFIAAGEKKSAKVTASDLETYLGVKKYHGDSISHRDEVGIVKGLAWTAAGGEILEVEVNVLEGSGKLELTGNLGDVMKESAKAAISYIRSRAEKLGIDKDFYKTKDIHIHFPEGAIPKDGPSAGITMTVAVISALTGTPVRRDVAMTGEITLSGRVFPIGGLKEKTMAALRAGVHTVIIPAENERDLENIDQTVRGKLHFVPTSHVDNILSVAMDFSLSEPKQSREADGGIFTETGSKKRVPVPMRQ